MREFKFRFWDSQNVHNVSRKGELQLTFGMNETWSAWSPYEEVADGKDTENKLMQYTGLKDRNGKGIYEGDIIQTGSIVEKVCFGEFVIYDENDNDICSVIGFYTETKNNSRYPLEVNSNTEIIGNIYENLELL
jgi:uncharacterized phage protein (TIGR01671 family)